MPLRYVRVVTLAVNVLVPAAAARLCELGASAAKVEPPGGDPLARSNPAWYEALAAGQEVVRLDLKDASDRARLDEHIAEADVLLTSSRPAAPRRLGLEEATKKDLERVFLQKTAEEWEQWAQERDLPIKAVS